MLRTYVRSDRQSDRPRCDLGSENFERLTQLVPELLRDERPELARTSWAA